MNLRKLSIIGGMSVLAITPLNALAGDAQFGITGEFMSVCGAEFSTVDEAAKHFTDAGWALADKDTKDALKPDDFLTKIKDTRAFTVDLDNGATWLGAVAQGKMSKSKVIYCGFTAIDDNPDGYRQDFELASALKASQTVTPDLERRDVYNAKDSKSLFIMREIRSPDLSYFTYIKVSPQAKKGK